MTPERRDVVIAGAGLVGLAIAAAVARHGLTVALNWTARLKETK